MVSGHGKQDSPLKSCLPPVWRKPPSSDVDGLHRPGASQHGPSGNGGCWQVWCQRPTRWTLGTVRLMDTGTHSRRLAIDTWEQNVFTKLPLERSSAKREVKGWALRHAGVARQAAGSSKNRTAEIPGDKPVRSKERTTPSLEFSFKRQSSGLGEHLIWREFSWREAGPGESRRGGGRDPSGCPWRPPAEQTGSPWGTGGHLPPSTNPGQVSQVPSNQAASPKVSGDRRSLKAARVWALKTRSTLPSDSAEPVFPSSHKCEKLPRKRFKYKPGYL